MFTGGVYCRSDDPPLWCAIRCVCGSVMDLIGQQVDLGVAARLQGRGGEKRCQNQGELFRSYSPQSWTKRLVGGEIFSGYAEAFWRLIHGSTAQNVSD